MFTYQKGSVDSMNIKKAQINISKVQNKFATVSKVKWTDVYSSESEIINDLLRIHIPRISEWCGITFYKGYEYIHSFAKQVQSGKVLSEKQLIQCKRLALEIKKAASIADCYE